PISTELGGAVFVPMAVRSRLSTMMMRVKPVIISSMAGRNESMVMKTSVSILNDQVWLPSGPGVAVSAGTVACAAASPGRATSSTSNKAGIRGKRFMDVSAPFQGPGQGGGEAGGSGHAFGAGGIGVLRGGRQGMEQGDLLGGDAHHEAGVFHVDNGHPGAVAQILRSRYAQCRGVGVAPEAGASHGPGCCKDHHQDQNEADDDPRYIGFIHGLTAAAQAVDAVGRRDDGGATTAVLLVD